MWFNSITFFIFLALTFTAFYAVRRVAMQIAVLVVSSMIFYAWSVPVLLLLLIFSVLLNAIISFQVSVVQADSIKRTWAVTGVVLNVATLAFFKYGALFASLVGELLEPANALSLKQLLTLPLPVGISFYTFEGISLLVDSFSGKVGPNQAKQRSWTGFIHHLGSTSLFICFFPHLVAGPILKANHFFPQIGPKRFIDIPWQTVVHSLILGYFLKCVIADNLKDHTFWLAYPQCLDLGSVNGLVLTFAYSIEIFADFAGYSLMAIGLGAAFGYELPQNFNYPYIASSLKDFWRRWHISLSTWLRDYLYFPLGGNRGSKLRTYLNLFLVMLLGGLWHGAAWSYMVWGAYHGLGLAVERFCAEQLPRPAWLGGLATKTGAAAPRGRLFLGTVQRLAVFLFVAFGWLLFQLTEIGGAWEFVSMLAVKWRFYINTNFLAATALYSTPVILLHLLHLPALESFRKRWMASYPWSQDIAYGLMLCALVINRGSSSEFIYFQF